jgi:hypothetical protein
MFSLFTFHVLRMFCRIRTFSSIGRSYDENFLHLCFISHYSNWGGIKEFPLFIYPYSWVLIFSDILLICFGERLKQFFTGIPWKNLRVQNFSILQFWKDLLKQFSTGTLWKWVLEYYLKLKSKRYIFNKLYWSFINNFIRKNGQSNLYCRVSKLFYSLPSLTKRKRRKGIDEDCTAAYIS